MSDNTDKKINTDDTKHESSLNTTNNAQTSVKRSYEDDEIQLKQKKIYIHASSEVDFVKLLNGGYRDDLQKETHVSITVIDNNINGSTTNDIAVIISGTSDDNIKETSDRISELASNIPKAKQLIQKYHPISVSSYVPTTTSTTPSTTPNYASAIAAAQAAVASLNAAAKMPHDDVETTTYPVNNDCVGLIIGKKAETLNRLRSLFGVDLRLQRDDEVLPNSVSRMITLTGPHDKIEKAKAGINLICQTKSIASILTSQPTTGGYDKFTIPNNKVGLVIGARAATLKGLRKQFGVDITIPQVPNPEDPSVRDVELRGEPGKVMECRNGILRIVSGDTSVVTPDIASCTVIVPDDKIGLIIGKSGTTFRELQKTTHCHLDIPQLPTPGTNPPTRAIILRGEVEDQMKLKQKLSELLGEPVVDVNDASSANNTQSLNKFYESLISYYGPEAAAFYFNFYQQQQTLAMQRAQAATLASLSAPTSTVFPATMPTSYPMPGAMPGAIPGAMPGAMPGLNSFYNTNPMQGANPGGFAAYNPYH